MRRYCFEHLLNMRDLGGIPLPGGGYTVYGSFIRSEAPTFLTECEHAKIKQLGIDTVVDLRSEHEINANPNMLAGKDDIDYFICPQKGGWEMPKTEAEIPATYMRIVSGYGMVLPVLKVFAQAKGAALFHCAAGKDRTGVFAALLLMIVGAETRDIIADYEVSYTYRKDIIDEKHRAHPEIPYFWSLSRPEYMAGFLQFFAAEYGDIIRYCSLVGLSEAEYAAIRAKLTRGIKKTTGVAPSEYLGL